MMHIRLESAQIVRFCPCFRLRCQMNHYIYIVGMLRLYSVLEVSQLITPPYYPNPLLLQSSFIVVYVLNLQGSSVSCKFSYLLDLQLFKNTTLCLVYSVSKQQRKRECQLVVIQFESTPLAFTLHPLSFGNISFE